MQPAVPDLKVFGAALLAYGLAFALLRRVNLPPAYRHKQWWSPPVSGGIGLGLLSLYAFLYEPLAAALEPLLDALQRAFNTSPWSTPGAVALVGNLLLLLGYAAAKGLVLGGSRLERRLRRSKDADADEAAGRNRFDWAHTYDEAAEHVVIKPPFVYPGLVFRYLGGFAAVLLVLAATVHATLYALPLHTLLFPIPPVLLLLETGWYLDGLRLAAVDPAERFAGGDETATTVGTFEALYRSYLELFDAQLLVAAARPALLHPQPGAAASYRYQAAPDPLTAEVNLYWNTLRRRHTLRQPHYDLLRQLLSGKDVILNDVIYEDLAPVMGAYVEKLLAEGHRILVLVDPDRRSTPARYHDVKQWFDQWLGRSLLSPLVWRVATLEEYRPENERRPHLIVASPGALLETSIVNTDREEWFDEVRLVLILNASATAMAHLASARSLLQVLTADVRQTPADHETLQVVTISDDRHNLESGLRTSLPGDYAELSLQGSPPGDVYLAVWRQEGPRRFQQYLSDRQILSSVPAYLGSASILGLWAWRSGVETILALGQETQPWDEYVEELLQNDRLQQYGLQRSALGTHEISWLAHPRERPLLLIHDQEHNLIAALRKYLPLGRQAVFAHVVAPPYLFRDYYAANASFFLHNPDRALALTPVLDEKSENALAYEILERLVHGTVEEAELLGMIRKVMPEALAVEDALNDLFRRVFEIDLRESAYLKGYYAYVFTPRVGSEDTFEERTFFAFTSEIKQDHVCRGGKLAWLRRLTIRDSNDRTQGHIMADHVYQTYLPGQIHTFRSQEGALHLNKPFKIVDVDVEDNRRITRREDLVRTVHQPEAEPSVYRPHLTVTLDAFDVRKTAPEVYGNGLRVERALGYGKYTVHTHGYFAFGTALTLQDSRFTPLHTVPDRVYPRSRMLRLRVTPPADFAGDPATAAYTMATLLNESFYTFFPETYAFLHAAVPGIASDALRHVTPPLTLTPGFADANTPEEDPDVPALTVYFLEDAHTDVGLAACLFRDLGYVLEQIADYLTWLLEDGTPRLAPSWTVGTLPGDAYLRYGRDVLPGAIDLKASLTLLRLMLPHATLTADREHFTEPASAHAQPAPPDGMNRCDLCGGVLDAAEFERLADGRERCSACKQTAVDTLDALQAVYDEARAFLTETYGVTLTRDVDVVFADAHAIAEAVGETSFVPTADYDPRAVGLAVQRGSDQFAVLIERGGPYHMVLYTVVHELTHIWQYTAVDVLRMEADTGLLLLEGHAVWTGLECLTERHLTPDYVRQQAERADVYGEGYRHIVQQLRTMPQYRNPFDWLQAAYPIPKRSA